MGVMVSVPYDGQAAPPSAGGPFAAGRIGKTAAVRVWINAISGLLLPVSTWITYFSFKDDLQSFDPDGYPPFELVALLIAGITGIAAAVAFIAWLRRVRGNAERFCKAPHRRRRGWLIWGWICPVVNLWFPKQIVDDIVAASTPTTDPQAAELPRLRTAVVQTWWITWVASNLITVFDPGNLAGQLSAGDLLRTAILTTLSGALTVVCAVYAVRVIRLIDNLQASRSRVAWWDVTVKEGTS
jgi:hypothetical protein